MHTCRIIVSVLYAFLMLFAVIAKSKESKKIDVLMLAGALLLLVANFQGHVLSLILAVGGLLMMHGAAFINGKNNGKINITHHLIDSVDCVSRYYYVFLLS